MKFSQRYFTIIFWSVFLVVMIADSVVAGKEQITYYEKTPGHVVDQMMIWSRTSFSGGHDVSRPQISYFVDNKEYFFVDHNASIATGRDVTVLYLKSDLHQARVYDFWFWINGGHLVPGFLISLLVYRVVIILSSKFRDEPEVLPSNTPL